MPPEVLHGTQFAPEGLLRTLCFAEQCSPQETTVAALFYDQGWQ